MDSDYEEWDEIYRRYPLEALPWELGRPRKVLVELVEKGLIKKGKALDICCGAGTDALYLTKKRLSSHGNRYLFKSHRICKGKSKKSKRKNSVPSTEFPKPSLQW